MSKANLSNWADIEVCTRRSYSHKETEPAIQLLSKSSSNHTTSIQRSIKRVLTTPDGDHNRPRMPETRSSTLNKHSHNYLKVSIPSSFLLCWNYGLHMIPSSPPSHWYYKLHYVLEALCNTLINHRAFKIKPAHYKVINIQTPPSSI
jgi:hypothetical protein